MTPAAPQPSRRRAATGRAGIPLLPILPLVAAAACGDVAGPGEAPELFGRWDVVRTCGGIFPACHEPEQPTTVAFVQPDSVVVEVAGSVTERHRFRVVEDDATIYGAYDAVHVWADPAGEWTRWMVIRQLTTDSLRLGDDMADGYTMELARQEVPRSSRSSLMKSSGSPARGAGGLVAESGQGRRQSPVENE